MPTCPSVIKITDDVGLSFATICCQLPAHDNKTLHCAVLKSLQGRYTVTWDFDDAVPWWYEEIPLWGRHSDGTPRSQDEFKVKEELYLQCKGGDCGAISGVHCSSCLKNQTDAKDSPSENKNPTNDEPTAGEG